MGLRTVTMSSLCFIVRGKDRYVAIHFSRTFLDDSYPFVLKNARTPFTHKDDLIAAILLENGFCKRV